VELLYPAITDGTLHLPTANIDNAIIITSKTEHNTRKFANELATTINNKSIDGPPKGVRLIKDGKLMIIPKDQNQYNKIRENLQNLNNIEIREKHKSEPLFIITGIEKGLTFLKKGNLEIDCQLHYAEEYLALAICYNCCRFGHRKISTNCTENHNARDCRSETLKWINCWHIILIQEPYWKFKGFFGYDSFRADSNDITVITLVKKGPGRVWMRKRFSQCECCYR
ncbi:hypothetical protein NQ317_001895, partial [Molorchus minor]